MTEHKKLSCEICKKEIPRSVAVSAEGAEYVHHFCSEDCREHYFDGHPECRPVDDKTPKR
jgi:hypothetical protein